MNENQETIRIVIADDHALVRGGISMLVNSLDRNTNIIESNSFDKTLSILSQESDIDLVLLDLQMPGMDGMDGIREICTKRPDVPVIIITVTDDSKSVHKALKAGAVGYIPKSSTPDVTMSAIRLVLSGGVYLPPIAIHMKVSEFSRKVIDDDRALTDIQQSTDMLTNRQVEVLDLMSEGKSNKEIAETLGQTVGSVKMHISRIFKVLEVSNRTEAVLKSQGRNNNL